MHDNDVIRFTCPHCDKRLRFKASSAGKRVRCPNPDCARAIEVPLDLGKEFPEPPATSPEQESDGRVRIKCPHCSTKFRVTKRLLGRDWKCMHCGKLFVPEEFSAEAERFQAAFEAMVEDAKAAKSEANWRAVGSILLVGLVLVGAVVLGVLRGLAEAGTIPAFIGVGAAIVFIVGYVILESMR